MLSALEHRSTASAGEHHRPAPWRGSVVHDAAPSMLYHASHPQWPSRPPLELAPSGSQIERGRLSRTVAGRTRTEPSPFAAAASRQPSAVQPYSRQPSARTVAVAAAAAAAVSELLRRVADAVWTRAAQRRASVLGVGSARARADGACKQTACTAHSFKIPRLRFDSHYLPRLCDIKFFAARRQGSPPIASVVHWHR